MVRPKLTQQRLEYARHQPIYMAVIADLAYAGVIDKDKAEEVMGWDIPDYYPESIESIIYKKQHGTVNAPAFSPAAGEVESGATITMSTTTVGATIYYTTDGSTPDATKTKYTAPVAITEDTNFKAIAIKGGKSSSVTSASYTIAVEPEQVATPVADPVAGEVESGTEVELTCATAGATIYYTDDGTEPTAESGTEYTTKIAITEAVTIKAIAVKEGMTDSEVLTAAYTTTQISGGLTPELTPTPHLVFSTIYAPGFIAVGVSDSISTLLYTTDGSTPSESNENTKVYNRSVGTGSDEPDFTIEIEGSWYTDGVTIKYCDAEHPYTVGERFFAAEDLGERIDGAGSEEPSHSLVR